MRRPRLPRSAGQGVHEAFSEILDAERLRQLTEAGRYRRDLY
jgi:hypothetical protein